jgi:hypothetical protein
MIVRKITILLVLLLLTQSVLALAPQDPDDIKINLTKTTYSKGENLEGALRIDFENPAALNTIIKLKIGNKEKSRKLIDLLDDLSLSYEKKDSLSQTSNPTLTKTLIFTSAGSQIVSLKLPEKATVNSITGNIKGLQSSGQYPSSPKIDVASDSNNEFEFLGSFTDFNTITSYPESLTLTSESTAFTENDLTYYCEIINLPASKSFNISSKYALKDASVTNGNIKAAILSFYTQDSNVIAQGGANNCDLPEPTSTDLKWNECQIEFQNTISGNYLACVYDSASTTSQSTQQRYKIATDTTTSTSQYTCKNPGSTGKTCQKINSRDAYIRINHANYGNELQETISFSQGSTQHDFSQSLTDYLKTCTPDSSGDCTIPLTISTSSKGKLQLSGLKIQYRKGVSREENNFYDISTIPGYIHQIDQINLTNGYQLELPLYLFEFAAPEKEDTYKLEAFINPGPSEDDEITVVSSTSSVNIIESTRSSLSSIASSNSQILGLMGLKEAIDSTLDILLDYETEYALAGTESEKTSILNQVESLRANLPSSIKVIETATDLVKISPSDITDLIEPLNKEKLYFYQKTLRITSTAKLYEIKSYSGKKAYATEITKQTNAGFSDEVYEIIPTAVSAGEVFFETPINQLNNNIYKFTQGSIHYLIPSNVMSSIADLKTIVKPSSYPVEIENSYTVCGDGKCTSVKIGSETIPLEDALICPQDCSKKYPWTALVIVVLLLAIGIYYINFFHPKSSKKSLFTSKQDEESLKKYIKKTLSKGVSRSEIINILSKKGWTKAQIDHAFKKSK